MPNVDLTEMDLAVIECLRDLDMKGTPHLLPSDLTPCLQRAFPRYDEVAMREGESVTRLRGRQLIDVDTEGRLSLTSLGTQMADGLKESETRVPGDATDH